MCVCVCVCVYGLLQLQGFSIVASPNVIQLRHHQFYTQSGCLKWKFFGLNWTNFAKDHDRVIPAARG